MDRKDYLQDLIDHYEEHLKNKNTKGWFLNNMKDFEPVSHTHLTLPTTPYV